MFNPMLAKDLRIQMRDRMIFSLSMLYVVIICAVVFGMFWLNETSKKPLSPEYGRDISNMFFIIMAFLISAISSGLGARLIYSERNGINFDLLKITLLKPYQIISGKILSLIIYIIVLMLLSLPILIIIISISGFEGIAKNYLLVFISALTFGIIGLMWSSFFRNARTSIAMTYISAGLLSFGTIVIPLILKNVFKIKIPQIPLKIINSVSPFISIYKNVTESIFILPSWEIMTFSYLFISIIAIIVTLIRLKSITG